MPLGRDDEIFFIQYFLNLRILNFTEHTVINKAKSCFLFPTSLAYEEGVG